MHCRTFSRTPSLFPLDSSKIPPPPPPPYAAQVAIPKNVSPTLGVAPGGGVSGGEGGGGTKMAHLRNIAPESLGARPPESVINSGNKLWATIEAKSWAQEAWYPGFL